MDANTVSAIAASASAFAAAIALIANSLQVHYLRKQLSQDHEWKRREKALLYSQVFHPSIREARERLSSKIKSDHIPIPWSELEEKIVEDKTIDNDIQNILIYIENIGLAVHHHVADFQMIYDITGTSTILFCARYRAFIDKTRQKTGNQRVWENVDRLERRLMNERNARIRAEEERDRREILGLKSRTH